MQFGDLHRDLGQWRARIGVQNGPAEGGLSLAPHGEQAQPYVNGITQHVRKWIDVEE